MKMGTLNEAYKANPLSLDDITPIDFSSVPSLPDSHTWSEPIDDESNDPATSSIPIIDLMDPNVKTLLIHACENWGVFILKNHGIPLDVIEGAEKEVQRLFSLPTEQKMKALRSPSGGTGYGNLVISPFLPKGLWHEGFTIVGSPSHDAKKIWPDDYQQFSDAMENYKKEMNTLAARLIEMVLEVLEISEEKKKWIGSSGAYTALQLNSYPKCPDPNRAMGMAPHTDTSIFTILHTKSSGLQAMKEGKWISVHPHPNAFIFHVGDFLHIMSNGRFPTLRHRVVVNNTERYSMGYFYSPPKDYVVSPSATEDFNSVPRFRDVTVKEYAEIKTQKFGDSLSSISI